MRKIIAAMPIVMAAFAANVWAIGEARYTGKIVDTANKPVGGATITVDSLEQRKFHQVFKANDKGEFAIFLLDGTIRYKFLYEKKDVGSFVEEKKLKLAPEKNEATVVIGATAAATSGGVTSVAKADPATTAYNEGAQLANAGDTKGAIGKMEEAVKLNADLTAAWIALASLYTRTEEWAKVIDAGTKALAVDADDADLNALVAQAYRKTGNAAKAAEYSKNAPKDAKAIFNEAAKYINAGNADKAEPLLKEAIEADPKFANAYYELGMIYAGQSKNAEAKKNLSKYLELEPNGKDAATAKEMLSYIK
jgi:tetratricopeptide (TPR) repeat protein